MSRLTLTTNDERPLSPLVEAALDNELRMLEVAIQRTEKRLSDFDAAHRMSSAQFVQRYENDDLPETLEFDEWIGEYRLLERLIDKADTYRAIRFI